MPEACGIGPWSNESDADLFVAVGARDGDGSQERPFGSIQEAADELGDDGGGVAAIAGGTYVENLELNAAHDGVVLAGRCAELVTIDGSGAEEPGITVTRGRLEVRGATVTGGLRGIAVVRAGGPGGPTSLVLRSIVVDGNRDIGLLVFGVGASVEAVGATIRETASRANGSFGRGVDVEAGGSLDATDLLVEGNRDVGLYATDAETTVALSCAVVRDTQPEADGTGGRGVSVQDGASLYATDLLVESNHEVGLYASNPGTAVALSGVVVRDTKPRADGTGGRGVSVQDGASLDATDLLLEGNREVGLYAWGPGTIVALSGVVVRDTQMEADGTGGRGVEVSDMASLDATDLLLEGNHDIGLFADNPGTTVTLSGAVVRDTQPQAAGAYSGGVGIQDGASLDATDLVVEGNHDIGLLADNPGTTVMLSGAVVRDTRLRADGSAGRGVGVQNGASLDATDLVVEGNHDTGLFASRPGTTVTLTDTVVRDTRPGFGVGGGVGLTVQLEAHIDAVRLAVLRSTGPGAYVAGSGLECQDCTFEDNGFGGLVVVGDSRVNLLGGSILSSQAISRAGGGGVGLLAWNLFDFPPSVHLDGVAFSGHPGPALYFRGPGTYAVRDCVVEDSAFASGVFDVPGAIVAVQGVGAWDPTAGEDEPAGLLLADNTFSSLPTNAVLLDGSAATLDTNLFEGITGVDLYTQRCSEAPAAVELLGPPPSTSDCAGTTLLLEPLLRWLPVILETEAVE